MKYYGYNGSYWELIGRYLVGGVRKKQNDGRYVTSDIQIIEFKQNPKYEEFKNKCIEIEINCIL